MNHARAAALLSAYADGQVNPIRRMLLRRHYDHCPSCLAQLEAVQTTRAAIKANLPTHRAPPGLASRIASALPREAVTPPSRRSSRAAWGFGGSGLVGALAGVAMTLMLTRPPDPLVADIVSDHVRSLMADHLTDVLTSDQHTVKPWLSARLPLSPVVKDLKTDGFPLVGGRLDYVEDHRAAALVYRRDKHVINLFVYADSGPEETSPTQAAQNGFNVVRWRMGGLTYVAVSDVELKQLLSFVHLVSAGD